MAPARRRETPGPGTLQQPNDINNLPKIPASQNHAILVVCEERKMSSQVPAVAEIATLYKSVPTSLVEKWM